MAEEEDIFSSVSSANVIDTDSSLSTDEMIIYTDFTTDAAPSTSSSTSGKKMVHVCLFHLTFCQKTYLLKL